MSAPIVVLPAFLINSQAGYDKEMKKISIERPELTWIGVSVFGQVKASGFKNLSSISNDYVDLNNRPWKNGRRIVWNKRQIEHCQNSAYACDR